ncbi:unnamed protein product, partial [marine sediment metagenome]
KSIIIKVKSAIEEYPEIKSVLSGGGVLNNEKVCRGLGRMVRKDGRKFLLPPIKYRTDNASMIALVGLRMMGDGQILTDPAEIRLVERIPRFSIDDVQKS